MDVNSKDKVIDKNIGWSTALAAVEREIIKSRRRIYLLRNSAKIIRNKIGSGEPWPGNEKAGTDAKSIPA